MLDQDISRRWGSGTTIQQIPRFARNDHIVVSLGLPEGKEGASETKEERCQKVLMPASYGYFISAADLTTIFGGEPYQGYGLSLPPV